MQAIRTFTIKCWRISCANALAITGGFSVLLFVEAPMLTAAWILTIVSLFIFYAASLRDFGELDETPMHDSATWQTMIQRLWKITLANILWIFGGLTYIFFCSGPQLIPIVGLTVIGFIMMYIDAYRTLVKEEQDAS